MSPHIHVDKNPSLADEAIDISITGLNTFQRVSLHATSQLANGAVFESTSHYIANGSGCISIRSDKSHGGSYTGVWPMGPISFMTPSKFNKRTHERFLVKDPMKPFTITLKMFDSFIPTMLETTDGYTLLAELAITRTYTTPSVVEQEIHEGRVRGTLYLPSKKGKFPGVISMSGGYPGAMKHKAAILASHGFAALALRYFGTDDLPTTVEEVDLKYFVEAANFLKNHPNVQATNGLGIVANCAGAALALATATCASNGLIGCVVAISGWFFSFANFEYEGQKWKPSFVTNNSINLFKSGPDGSFIYDFDANVPTSLLSADKIPSDRHFAFYKRLHTAYMFVHGGEDADLNNNSVKIEGLARDLLRSSKHSNYEFLFYPSAGHLIEHAYFPFAKITWTLKMPRFFGGTQPYHSMAQEDSWPKILEFVRINLTRNMHKLILVDKNPSLADEPVAISIEGLNSFQRISLYARTELPNNAGFESLSHYVADGAGCISLKTDKSFGGTYEGVWPMGPFSSMVPASTNERKYERFLLKEPSQPFTVQLQVFDSFISKIEEVTQHEILSQYDITRTYMTSGVTEMEVRLGRIRATLFLPSKDGKFPGVISMSGGYPGAMKHKAALLASHGFAALALKFFGTDDLPGDIQELDLSYFVDAAYFLKNHPNVDSKNGVGIIANCSGASLALATATCAPDGLIGCVVAISGWFYCFGKYWYENQVWKPSRSLQEVKIMVEHHSDGTVHWVYEFAPELLKEKPDDTSHFAFYKRLHTAYMFVHGGKDGYFSVTKEFSQMAEEYLLSVKHPNYEILFYPDAGHLIEHAYSPPAKVAWTFHEPHFNGGEQPGHGKAQEDSWPKILRFVYDSLTKKNNKL